ncbi:MAG TPA: CHAT domain-containing protein [Pseudomonadota bacterium]|nr:CHAT domain-containing protein [Pseudomonadota bacterium]
MTSYVTIVFAAANPRSTAPLQIGEEIRRIEQQIAGSRQLLARTGSDGLHAAPRLSAAWAVRFPELLQQLSAHQPVALHFSGHGHGRDGLVLHGDEGNDSLIDSQTLKAALAEYRNHLRLVVLNACYARVQAEALREVIDCVIGMRDEITDVGALAFSAALYGQLALGISVGRAFRLAVAALSAESRTDAEIPVLLTRPGVDADQVFLTTAAPTPKASDDEPEWKRIIASEPPARPALRKAINLLFETDADLDAFVADRRDDPRYARVYREWGGNMQRTAKINLLFTYGPPPSDLKRDLLAYAG